MAVIKENFRNMGSKTENESQEFRQMTDEEFLDPATWDMPALPEDDFTDDDAEKLDQYLKNLDPEGYELTSELSEIQDRQDAAKSQQEKLKLGAEASKLNQKLQLHYMRRHEREMQRK